MFENLNRKSIHYVVSSKKIPLPEKFSTFFMLLFGMHISEVPLKHKQEFNEEIVKINLQREKNISYIIIFLNLLFFIFDMNKYNNSWDGNMGYRYLFYSRIIIVTILTTFILLYNLKIKKGACKSLKCKKFLHFSIVLLTLFWCVFISINAQSIHGQISAYIIGSFCIASFLFLKPLESLILFTSTFSVLILGLYSISQTNAEFLGNILNALFVLLLSYFVSVIHYSYYTKLFINKKEILQKNIKLEEYKKELEKIIDMKTSELQSTNCRLMDEVNKKLNLELQAIKNKYLYEEQIRKLEEAKKYEQIRTEFFANISHELKTPLNVIFSAEQMLELTLKKTPNDHDLSIIYKYTKMIKQNCYRLIRIISNLIDITKLDAGYFEVELSNNNIIKIVEDITLSVAAYVENQHINLIFDTELEEQFLACDPEKIERIILNLLSNSVKFTPKNGTIKVNIFDCRNSIKITIKDDGIGIPLEIQPRIFDRFVQADKSTSRNREGSGIGLSLVKSLVELHNGSINLKSELGKGTEFIIELPKKLVKTSKYNTCDCNLNNDQSIERIQIEFSDIYL